MSKIQEAIDALDEVKAAINSAYETGYSVGKRHWIELTDFEINTTIQKWDYEVAETGGGLKKLVAMVEAVLRDKNT